MKADCIASFTVYKRLWDCLILIKLRSKEISDITEQNIPKVNYNTLVFHIFLLQLEKFWFFLFIGITVFVAAITLTAAAMKNIYSVD